MPVDPPVVNPIPSPASSPLSLSGASEPGATITVYVDGNSVGTAVADQSGAWSLSSVPLDAGPHAFSACAAVTSPWASDVTVTVSNE